MADAGAIKSEDTDKKHIRLILDGQDGRSITVQIKRHAPLEKAVTMFSQVHKIAKEDLRLIYDGDRISFADTPFKLGLKDEDSVDVCWRQDGGHHTT